ncbi:type IX secretion system anionic LPS delivery protein PorZ [Brumimicrobium oceani]|uniref:PorZ N-terminal beta-propeller domain-containing protein n=1 Tax=Brumimicrobium oceani TaxID=2100725 RepID=A0A2U2XCV6_9FLAO|nr:two-component regulator propeller domain-containing protein [Brumimicrobium oceani]PWH85639.1 hypothetical protein DIT68_08355 [Brumimicrobium oceani]
MRKIGTLLIAFGFSLVGLSQLGMGEWRMHISPNSAIDVVEGNNVIYAIMNNGMLEYDLEQGEKTVWTVANYLSDVSPSAVAFDKGSASLLIGYETGNLDIINNNSVYNLPAIVQSSVNGLKRINRIAVKEGFAYMATGVGIVVVNLNKNEIKDTYNPTTSGTKFIDVAFYQDSIYVLTEEGVYVGKENNSFLADPSQWKKMNKVPDYTANGVYNELEVFDDKLFLSYNHDFYNGDTLFQIVNGVPTAFLDEVEIHGLDGLQKNLLVSVAGSVYNYDLALNQVDNVYQYQNTSFPEPAHACIVGNDYYIADRKWGLVKASNAFNSSLITFGGPRYNSAYRSKWRNGTLAVAGGGLNGTGPSFSKRGGATMTNDEWISTVISEEVMTAGTPTWDFISTAINPKNTKEVAYGSYSGIPLVITNEATIVDTFVFSNSLIEETGNVGWGYISDIEYDDQGNLWVANANAVKPLKVKSEEGVWYEFNVGSAVNNRITGRLLIDNNNTKWMAVIGAGLLAFNEGENIDDASDDKYRFLSTAPNNGGLPSNSVEAIAQDFEGNIWIGTPEGMRVLYSASNIFEADPGQYDFQKLLIQFGENVEIVLGTTHITSIEIDGANRKWIGTASSGVFLLSPDGLGVERNFTSENSPLLSNTILDISINQTNGEVFFLTEDGLISYRSDASQGDLEYESVNVFPNPVHPEFSGPITIQGIAYNSDVKITDISGKLVYQTISNGGTATWSGKTMDGKRAATGVYLIWTSVDDPEVKGRQVGKVVLIN